MCGCFPKQFDHCLHHCVLYRAAPDHSGPTLTHVIARGRCVQMLGAFGAQPKRDMPVGTDAILVEAGAGGNAAGGLAGLEGSVIGKWK